MNGAGVPVDKSGSEPDRLERLRKLALLHGLNVQRVQAVDGASDFIPECDVCRSWSKEARDINR